MGFSSCPAICASALARIELALSASLCFEQSYRSFTVLYALLSRLANIPFRRDITVTDELTNGCLDSENVNET
jgi:hypothetical protein